MADISLSQNPNPLPNAPPQKLQNPDPPPKPIPPSPDPPPISAIPLISKDPPPHNLFSYQDPIPKQRWSSLFAAKPLNAGTFEVNDIELKFAGENLVPTDDIIQACVEQWNGFLVGFFLDAPLPYFTVVNFLKKHWGAQGTIEIKSNGTIFFFQFSSLADRIRVLEADPVIIYKKLFIIKPWEPSLSNVANSVKEVPVWIKMFNLPLVAWSKRGVSWLATRVGKFLCMDSNTESINRLEYAKCMVEVSANSPLPDEFPVRNLDGTIQIVKVYYLWKPELCLHCKVFGHLTDKCQNLKQKESETTNKVVDCSVISTQHQKDKGEVNVTTTNNDKTKRVQQRSRNEASTRDSIWTSVDKKKKLVRLAVNSKVKGKQAITDKSPAVEAVGTSNSFSVLPECEEVIDGYKINYEIEEGEIVNAGMNKAGKMKHTGSNVNKLIATGKVLQRCDVDPQANKKVDDSLEKVTRDEQIALVDGILSKTFQIPMDYGNGGAPMLDAKADGNNILDAINVLDAKYDGNRHEVINVGKSPSTICTVSNSAPMVPEAKTDGKQHEDLHDGEPLSTFSKVSNCKEYDLQKSCAEAFSTPNEKHLQENNSEMSAIESARSTHIRTINADILAISSALHAELASKDVDTPEYIATVKKQENFKEFCSGIVFDQLHTAQLDSVSDVLQKVIDSGKKKTRKSPIIKDKPANPYAHIAPPSAYKERPPDIITDPVISSSNDKADPKTHVTQSVKKDMLRNLHEKG